MMKRALILVLLLPFLASCDPVKIALFRVGMKVVGNREYSSRFIALYYPKFIPAAEASYLKADEEVIGVYNNGVAKAYPLTMSFHHHVFNDEVGGRSMIVTFCPLTHTAMAFDPFVDGRPLTFKVDGLKESNMMMIDDSTRSFWVQVTGEAVKGPLKGKRLDLLFALHTTWGLWRDLHPNTLVLSRDTGFDKDYSRFPFQEKYFKYKKTSRFLFSVSHRDKRYHPKEMMLGVEINAACKAYPFSALGDRAVVNDTVGAAPVVVLYDAKTQSAAAFSRILDGRCLSFAAERDSSGVTIRDAASGSSWNIEGTAYAGPYAGAALRPVRAFKAFWFAWIAFNPKTLVFTGSD
ncbi:MAG TPA: DUF3179 domain-containing protein [Candidatus Krumholzibacteriaceae bacterium]